MNVDPRFTARAFSSVAAGAAGLGLILTLGSSVGATSSASARMVVASQTAVRTPARLIAPSFRPRVTPSCSKAGASGLGAFDSTLGFATNKGAAFVFGNANFAAATSTGAFEGAGNTICDFNSAIVGGNANTIDSGAGNTPGGASNSMIGAGFGNTVSGNDSFVGAGATNDVPGTVSFIGAGHNNIVSGHLSFVGAGFGNLVSGPGSFIGAGGDITARFPNNRVLGGDSFIGAGDGNTVEGNEAFLGSGVSNIIAPAGTFAAIGGGVGNDASASAATIGGGSGNVASAASAAIGGGSNNRASGEFSTIAGGAENVASGFLSFAAGNGSVAATNGSFVWSDDAASPKQLESTSANQFLARASGGVEFFSNAKLTSGVKLAPGSGTWASLSDRAMKSHIVALDDAAVLAKVATLPVSEWSYTSESGVRHVGPMAQDFYATFGVGEDNRHITSIDEDGVALSAIKALHRENVALRAGMQGQHAELVILLGEIRELEAKVASTRSR